MKLSLSVCFMLLVCPGLATAETVEQIIDRESRHSGVVPELIKAVIKVESGFNEKATSHKGAGGLMQLMPDTAARFGVSDVYQPDQNIRAGSTYLAWLYRRYQSWPLALAGYNAGEGAVDRYGSIPPYRETQNYVIKVLNAYQHYAERAESVSLTDTVSAVSADSEPTHEAVPAKAISTDNTKPLMTAEVTKTVQPSPVVLSSSGGLLEAARIAPTLVSWEPPAGYYER